MADAATKLVFDPTLWDGRDQGDNSQFWKPATVLCEYVDEYGRLLADVRFHHDGRVSTAHFVEGMRDAG